MSNLSRIRREEPGCGLYWSCSRSNWENEWTWCKVACEIWDDAIHWNDIRVYSLKSRQIDIGDLVETIRNNHSLYTTRVEFILLPDIALSCFKQDELTMSHTKFALLNGGKGSYRLRIIYARWHISNQRMWHHCDDPRLTSTSSGSTAARRELSPLPSQ